MSSDTRAAMADALASAPPFASRWGTWAFFVAPSLVLVALLWLPFGFSVGALIEEWDVLAIFNNVGVFFWADADTPLALHRLRPLTVAPQALGYWLDPNSLFYWHILLIVSLVAKGVAGTWIAWWLTRSRQAAMMFGLLLIVYPADTMQLSFRALHINGSISLGLCAVACCIAALADASKGRRILLAAIGGSLAVIGTFMYEALLLFCVAPFLLVFARIGFSPTLRVASSRLDVCAVWFLATLVSAGYIIYVLLTADTYQTSVVSSAPLSQELLGRLPALFSVGFARALAGGWLDAGAITYYEYRHYYYVLLVGALLVIAASWLRKPAAITDVQPPALHLGRLTLAGVAILALGYLPFLLSPHHLIISQRTFLFTAPGAALVILVVLLLAQRAHRRFFLAASTALVLLGFCTQMYQFKHYSDISERQRALLASVVLAVPPTGENQSLLILDGTEQINNVWMLGLGMSEALAYVYSEPFYRVLVCSGNGTVWQRFDPNLRRGICRQDEEGSWEFKHEAAPGTTAAPQDRLHIKKDELLVVRIGPDGIASSSRDTRQHRQLLVTGNDPLSSRFRGMLMPHRWPLDFGQFRAPGDHAEYRWDFGRWWSMEVPVTGAGWRPPEWSVEGWERRSFAWKQEAKASLVFEMSPKRGRYVMHGSIAYMAAGLSRDAIKISVNGVPLEVQWDDDLTFVVEVPPSLLRRGRNMVEFDSPLDADYHNLSAALDWLRLDPAPVVKSN